MNASEGKRVHVTSRNLGYLKIVGYLDGYIVISNTMEHDKACVCPFVS